MNTHPFSRTPVIITLIIAGVVFVLGIVLIAVVFPDKGGRVASTLTITIPLFLTTIATTIVTLRTRRDVAATREKVDSVHKLANGTTSRLLDAVLERGTPPSTEEIQMIASEIRDNSGRGQ